MFLLESPLAIGAIGLLLVTLGGIAYLQLRTTASLGALLTAVLLAIAGVVGERLWITPTEAVRDAVANLFAAIEANDLPGVLRLVDAGATDVRSDAEVLMPQFRVQSASTGGGVAVELPFDPGAEGATATATLKPLIKVVHRRSGATAGYFDGLRLEFVRRGDRWLVAECVPAKDWRDEAGRLGR